PGPRLCPERHRSARYQPVWHAGCDWRHQVLGRVVGNADAVLVPAQGSGPEGRGLCRCRQSLRLPGTNELGRDGRIDDAAELELYPADPDSGDCGNLHRLGVRQPKRRADLGGCRSCLGLAVRTAALRLRDPADQGPVRPRAAIQVWRRYIVLISLTRRTAKGGMAQPTFFEQPPPSTLADIAALTKAHLADPARAGQEIRGLASPDEAGPMHLTFFDNLKYADQLAATEAGACLVSPRFEKSVPSHVAVLRVAQPFRAFVLVAREWHRDALRPQSWFGCEG